MELLESLIYGFVTGVSEFLPVSSRGHQVITMQLFGIGYRDPIRDLFSHLGALLALILCCSSLISQLQMNLRMSKRLQRGRNARVYSRGTYDLKLLKTAIIPLMIGLLFYGFGSKFDQSPLWIGIFLVINGVILYIPEHIPHGNKDAKMMTGADGILLGLGGALSVFPGISRIGAQFSISTFRGADKSNSLNWALLLSIPVLVLLMLLDIIGIFTANFDHFSFWTVIGYFLSAISAFGGGYLSIILMRFLTVHTGFAGFAYYSWGAAFFSFILHLIA